MTEPGAPTPPDWTHKRGDLLPALRAYLTTAAGPVDLTGVTSVRFVMEQVADAAGARPATPKVVTGAAVVVTGAQPDGTTLTAASGVVEYAWAAGDTDVLGDYEGEWETLWGTRPRTFPQATVHTIRVADDRG